MAKKLSKFQYYSKNKVLVEGEIKIGMKYGKPTNDFYLDIPEYNISLNCRNVEELQREAERLIDEKTSIEWKNFLFIELKGKTTDSMKHYFPMVKINLSVTPFKQGKNFKGQIFNNFGNSINEGDKFAEIGMSFETHNKKEAVYGFSPYDSFNKIFFFSTDKMKAIVDDTPENNAAIESLIAEFEAVLRKLFLMFRPEEIQKTLSSRLGNLLTSGTPKSLTAAPKSLEK